MRKAETERKTGETDITLSLDIDGKGESEISSGVGFLDHMLTLFSRHGRFDLKLKCIGDTYVDDHHSTEDIAIALGSAFRKALGDKRGIKRYGDIILPMDEALVLASVDISGRSYIRFTSNFQTEKIGTFDVELLEDFFTSFAENAGITLHIRQLDGRNSHHIAEAMFKAVARALRKAVEIDERAKDEIPSTKGVL
ncbi:MAG: imidazoleglycerol-phosphate dehydratase HisB [Candidatus Ornithospirochaeta sp.]|nr:imidazoleglycerol-phosphate dehydratase HisB [Sphaerochaetaceae bacterium]MDY5524019.1 imidazoleglycerol-phosphate dehydratase HisB [Candidatus Ornithospirochaeta sp.]